MNRCTLILLSCISLALPSLAGCGGHRGPEMAPASGVVTYQGQPLEGATVRFAGPAGRPSTGTTNVEGRFELSAFEPGDGAVVGENIVTITKYAPPSFEPEKNEDGSFGFESEAQMIAYYNRPSVLPGSV